MVKPSYLNSHDKVYLLSTARKSDESSYRAAMNWLESNGLEPVLGETATADYHQFAGEDEVRIRDLQRALDNPEIKAIWCIRGGYGTVRLIDQVDFDAFIKAPKWVVGYSDITALHCKLQETGFQSIHGTMPVNVPEKPNVNQEASMNRLKEVLFGRFEPMLLAPHPLNRTGTANGTLVGGNLSVLYSLLGSTTFPKTQGAVLFLEDLDEYLYHIDRIMMAFKRAGVFKGLNGLIVGGMTDMNDNTIPFGKDAETIIRESVDEFDFPVYFNVPAGHQDLNLPLILGAEVTLEQNTLKVNRER